MIADESADCAVLCVAWQRTGLWNRRLHRLSCSKTYLIRHHEHDFVLYNGGHADSKDRVGEKHGVRGAEQSLSPTPPGLRLPGDEWASGNICRVPTRLLEEITALCTRCFNCYLLRHHCGVGFVLQFLKISSDRHKIGASWHRLALVDLMSVKLCQFFAASTCNTRKRNQGSN